MVDYDDYEVGEDGLPRKKRPGSQPKRGTITNAPPEPVHRMVREERVHGKNARRDTEYVKPSNPQIQLHEADLPGGGTILLLSPQEVKFYEEIKRSLTNDFKFESVNDQLILGQLLTFHVQAHREQQRMMGQLPSYDSQGQVEGFVSVPDAERDMAAERLPKIQKEIRELEKALKIDKTSREGDGTYDIAAYFERLKGAALEYGVHISERYTMLDNFMGELQWRLRVYNNADLEDKRYHGIDTAEKLLKWAEDEANKFVEFDKTFARDKQAVWVGDL